MADAASDARITASIETVPIADPQLSALSIGVATHQQRVTLSGAAARPGLIGRAILLAYRTDGVREVESTIRVEAEG